METLLLLRRMHVRKALAFFRVISKFKCNSVKKPQWLLFLSSPSSFPSLSFILECDRIILKFRWNFFRGVTMGDLSSG